MPWRAVLSCDPDPIIHLFSFYFSLSLFSCDAGAVVFIVFNYIISFITNGNTSAAVVLFAMDSLRIRREESQRLESPTF